MEDRASALSVLKIIGFGVVLTVLERGSGYLLRILSPYVSGTWYPVCARVTEIALLVGLFALLRRWRLYSTLYPAGLKVDRAAAMLLPGLVVGAGLQIATDLALLPHSFWARPNVRQGFQDQWAHFPWVAVALFFAGGALREEAIWRGYVLEELERRMGSGWALILSAAAFGLWHLGKNGRTAMDCLEIGLNGGMLLGSAYLITKSLWLPMGLHFGKNIVSTFINGSGAFPDAAMPPVTFEAHGPGAIVQLLACRHLELLLGAVFVFMVVLSGRWTPRHAEHPL